MPSLNVAHPDSRAIEKPIGNIMSGAPFSRLNRSSLWAALTILSGAIAWCSPDYVLFQVSVLLTMVLAVHALNLLAGLNGQISLGNGAFFAIGAYASTILNMRFGIPYPIAIAGGGFAACLVGVGVGLPAVRLNALHLALATFALAIAVPQFLLFAPLEALTGGNSGLAVDKPSAPFGLPLNTDQWLYLLTLLIVSASLWFLDNVTRRSTGRSIVAIKDNALAAEALGIRVAHYKVSVFAISATATGIAGALNAILVQYVAPDSFQLFFSVTLLVGVAIGGLGRLSGSILGALFIQIVPTVVDQISKTATWAIYGATLVVFVMIAPSGIAGAIAQVHLRIGAWRIARAGKTNDTGALR